MLSDLGSAACAHRIHLSDEVEHGARHGGVGIGAVVLRAVLDVLAREEHTGIHLVGHHYPRIRLVVLEQDVVARFKATLPNGAVGQVLDIEDFLVSNLILPIGSLIYLLFCVGKWGWGFDNYLAEANTGSGLKLPRAFKPYFQFILPVLILIIIIQGLLP